MFDILIVLQLILVISIVISVLLHQSGDEGLTSSYSGGHGLISGKTSDKFITKTIFFLALAFMINSLFLAKITSLDLQKSGAILKKIEIVPDEETKTPSAPISE